ncbi:MAG: putative quinol monooxygenase [Pseudomonadota bacterium]
MFAVVVTFQLKAGQMADFVPLMEKNAATSLAQEPGCTRFDVCSDPERPDEVFLYELYDDRAAFDDHLQSAHFKAFDAAVGEMIAAKDIRTYATVVS